MQLSVAGTTLCIDLFIYLSIYLSVCPSHISVLPGFSSLQQLMFKDRTGFQQCDNPRRNIFFDPYIPGLFASCLYCIDTFDILLHFQQGVLLRISEDDKVTDVQGGIKLYV